MIGSTGSHSYLSNKFAATAWFRIPQQTGSSVEVREDSLVRFGPISRSVVRMRSRENATLADPTSEGGGFRRSTGGSVGTAVNLVGARSGVGLLEVFLRFLPRRCCMNRQSRPLRLHRVHVVALPSRRHFIFTLRHGRQAFEEPLLPCPETPG